MKLTATDLMFRKFQIQKFDKKRMVPAVSMEMNIAVDRLMDIRREKNLKRDAKNKITLTHIIMKAVSSELNNYPLLYSSFIGNRNILNKDVVLNIPVDVENHVEYIVIKKAQSKSLDEIVQESNLQKGLIDIGEGEFKKFIARTKNVPSFVKKGLTRIPGFLYNYINNHYGNFVISNFGSFNADRGIIAIAEPIVSSMCIGKINKIVSVNENGEICQKSVLPVIMVFDHRPFDGAYVGKFLNDLRTLLENPDRLFE